jgi:hypothetical protein
VPPTKRSIEDKVRIFDGNMVMSLGRVGLAHMRTLYPLE